MPHSDGDIIGTSESARTTIVKTFSAKKQGEKTIAIYAGPFPLRGSCLLHPAMSKTHRLRNYLLQGQDLLDLTVTAAGDENSARPVIYHTLIDIEHAGSECIPSSAASISNDSMSGACIRSQRN
ncbi:hypothetical protein F5146DRAFT_1003280 [Armillaria mellea]|nr:hypothetical protein F5146DRAFT_1003280 [Armillaria mellea]